MNTQTNKPVEEMTHTPGPWEVELAFNEYPNRIVAPKESNHAPGRVGSHITRPGCFTLPSSGEGLANAILMASSPDLYSALKRMLDENAGGTRPISNAARKQARAAIAKAEGKGTK